MEKLKLLGDRVVIALHKQEEHTTTSTGIIVPLSEITQTDGGKIASITSSKKYLSKGTVIQVSELAASKLMESNITLSPGDVVYLSENGASPQYKFSYNRDTLVQEDEGYRCVPHIIIEGVITNE